MIRNKLSAEIADGRVHQHTLCEFLLGSFPAGDWVVCNGSIFRYVNEDRRYIPVNKAAMVTKMFEVLQEVSSNARYCIDPRRVRTVIDVLINSAEHQSRADLYALRPAYLNAENGVIDLCSGEMITRDHEFWPFRYKIHASYLGDEDVPTPTFDAFCLSSLGKMDIEAKRKLLQEMIGYCLSDMTAGKCGMFLLGASNSGKSVLLRFIARFLGERAVREGLISNVGLHQVNNRFYRQSLCTSKLNIVGEIDSRPLEDIGTYKAVIGGDTIVTEKKHADPVFMVPTTKFLVGGNLLPPLTDTDPTDAFLNRLVVLTFPRSIPREEWILDLEEQLWAERDAIFTNAVHALMDLAARGFIFTCPESSQEFLDDFRREANSFRQFLAEMTVQRLNARISTQEFFAEYTRYCKENRFAVMPDAYCRRVLQQMDGVTIKRARVNGVSRHAVLGLSFDVPEDSQVHYESGEEYLARKAEEQFTRIMAMPY